MTKLSTVAVILLGIGNVFLGCALWRNADASSKIDLLETKVYDASERCRHLENRVDALSKLTNMLLGRADPFARR